MTAIRNLTSQATTHTDNWPQPTTDPARGAVWLSLKNMLRSYDLEELTDWAYQQFVNGSSTEEITLGLEEQQPFKTKFKAIFDRRAKGLPPVTVADLVSYRQQALQAERYYGLPSGFISSWDAVNNAVAADVSMNEMQDRIKLAAVDMQAVPAEVRDYFKTNYGLADGDLISYFADPNHALPLLERQFASAQIGGQAAKQGYGTLTRSEAERLAAEGMSGQQAAQGFAQLRQQSELFTGLPGTAESNISRDTQLGSFSDSQAAEAIRRRARERAAVFQEGGGFAGGLASGNAR